MNWMDRRKDILERMERFMGPLKTQWDGLPVETETLSEEKIGNVIRKHIRYQDQPGSVIWAYLMIPEEISGKVPGMICLHQTTGCGSREPAGLEGKENLYYALELAQRGMVTLAPDLPSFGEMKDVHPLPEGYVSGTMKDITIHRRGLDLLTQLPQVDSDRLGSIGHSLGGHNTLFLAAFEPRIKVAATSCGFTTWKAYAKSFGSLAAWAQDRYMPLVRDVYQNNPDKMSVKFEEILEAILPRAMYVNAPKSDSNFDQEGVKECMKYIRHVAAKQNMTLNLLVEQPDCGHDFPKEQRENCYVFIENMLSAKRG
ncbi:MAG TPA: acetylxylan esterase [Clostridiales bacterium]|nr:acetylxylan esterase [Clostridiales bacterium]